MSGLRFECFVCSFVFLNGSLSFEGLSEEMDNQVPTLPPSASRFYERIIYKRNWKRVKPFIKLDKHIYNPCVCKCIYLKVFIRLKIKRRQKIRNEEKREIRSRGMRCQRQWYWSLGMFLGYIKIVRRILIYLCINTYTYIICVYFRIKPLIKSLNIHRMMKYIYLYI